MDINTLNIIEKLSAPIFGLIISVLFFFLKRTLMDLTKNSEINVSKIDKLSEELNLFKIEQARELEHRYKEYLDSMETKFQDIEEKIDNRIKMVDSKSEKRIEYLEERIEEISKEFNTFKSQTPKEYVLISSYTATVNQLQNKMDEVINMLLQFKRDGAI